MNTMKQQLLGALVGLARASEEKELLESSSYAMLEGLSLAYNPSADSSVTDADLVNMLQRLHAEKILMSPDCASCQCPCGRTEDYDMAEVFHASEDLANAKLELFSLLGDLAALALDAASKDAAKLTAQTISDVLFQIGCTFEASQLEPWLEKVRGMLVEFSYGI